MIRRFLPLAFALTAATIGCAPASPPAAPAPEAPRFIPQPLPIDLGPLGIGARTVSLPVRYDDAVLPNRRVVAYYGHPASQRMGILGAVPPDQMLARLDREVEAWTRADPETPGIHALHLIATVAALDPGPRGLHRNLTPRRTIENVLEWASRRDAIVFLDIQPGFSSYDAELDRLIPYLLHPHVHLGIDPEFDMPAGAIPGSRVGTTDAVQINRLIDRLANIVERLGLPPKILVVHRFTQRMVTNSDQIELDPRVHLVMHMDGWGPPAMKRTTYNRIVAPEAPQFTGFKIFYDHDTRGRTGRLMTPAEILELNPQPVYIQYH